MRISDWSSDVCSSDLSILSTIAKGIALRSKRPVEAKADDSPARRPLIRIRVVPKGSPRSWTDVPLMSTPSMPPAGPRSEEHTSELQSLMRISYAVFCLTKKTTPKNHKHKD